jgi:hypothetical protein
MPKPLVGPLGIAIASRAVFDVAAMFCVGRALTHPGISPELQRIVQKRGINMNIRFAVAAVCLASLSACIAPSQPELPDTGPVSAAEIRSVVEGGPYALTIYDGKDAGTTGQSTWDFTAGTISGSFTTAEGQSGTFETPASIEGNKICAGSVETKQCHFVYRYRGGFLEVNDDGSIHAASVPL